MNGLTVENLKENEKCFGCTFSCATPSKTEWTRMFIFDSVGRTIGRISFCNNELRHFKNYKRDYADTLDETDQIMCRLCKYLKDRTFVSLITYEHLITKAKQIQAHDLKQKVAWREANPIIKTSVDENGIITYHKKSRKRLVGKNIRRIVSNLVMNL